MCVTQIVKIINKRWDILVPAILNKALSSFYTKPFKVLVGVLCLPKLLLQDTKSFWFAMVWYQKLYTHLLFCGFLTREISHFHLPCHPRCCILPPAHQLKGWLILLKLCVGDLLRIGFSPLSLPPVKCPSASTFPPFQWSSGWGILTLSFFYRVTSRGCIECENFKSQERSFLRNYRQHGSSCTSGYFPLPCATVTRSCVFSRWFDRLPAFGKIQISSASIFGPSPTLVFVEIRE